MPYLESVDGTTFAERLSKALETARLSIAGAADYLNVNYKTVERWANGDTEPPFINIMRLAARLGADPWYLAFGRTTQGAQDHEDRDLASELDAARADLRSLQDRFAGAESQIKESETLLRETQSSVKALRDLIEKRLPPPPK